MKPATARSGKNTGKNTEKTGRTTAKPGSKAEKPGSRPEKLPLDDPAAAESRTLRLGAVPGANPGRWIDTWRQRMAHVTLELVTIPFAAQRAAIADAVVDLALVRTPFDDEGMHAIPLYTEESVVIASIDSHLLAADALSPADLTGQTLLRTREDVLGDLELPTLASRIPPLGTVKDAVATVASGAGILVAPMSLARLHHRSDVDYRVLRGVPVSSVLLAWHGETTADIDAFIGIVRGRTANSSR